MEFECSGCSLCCQRVGRAVKDARKVLMNLRGKKADPQTKEVAMFPYKFDEKGTCEKLVDGKCSDYENRPDICNVKKSFEKFGNGRTEAQYYEANAKLCNTWIRQKKLDTGYLVKENYSI